MEFEVNKGIGRTVEFKGLKAQYLFLFAGGLLGVFLVVIILYMVGSNPYFCIGLGILGATLLVWQTFSLNRKYGTHGLMKLTANKRHPRYLLNRKSVLSLFTDTYHKNSKYKCL